MILNNKQLKQLHNAELEILKEFISICKKLNLRYFLIGGSALGTVRHNGFIPWDDDIDVGMPRKDYEIFLAEGPMHLSKKLFLQTTGTDKNYRNHFAKIRNSNTTFIEESVKDVIMNQGIFIDIFPLDGVGNNENEVKKNFSRYCKLHEIYIYKTKKHNNVGLRNKVRNIYYFLLSIPYNNVEKLENKIQKYCSSLDFDNSRYVCSFFGLWRDKEIVDKKWFGEGIVAKFEGIDVVIPEQYDLYLTKLYNNYMEFPPENKRVAPHCYILDLNKKYLDYIEK